MAFISTFTHHAPARHVAHILSVSGTRLLTWLASLAERDPRVREVARLSEMSDEELAALGLARAEIGRKVFSGVFYL